MDTAPLTTDPIVPEDGMVIRTDTRLKPGVYVLPQGITIDADNVTLDGNGAVLIGQDRQGAAVTVEGRREVEIRNVRAREYKHGIVARQSSQIRIANCQVTSTEEVEANTVFLSIWKPASDPYGGGILLDHVVEGEIVDNDVQHQMNGILSYHCRNLHVARNNASYNSGFGIHLFDTSESVYEDNWADYCNRYEPRDKGKAVVGAGHYGHMGADATGFLIVQNCCHNVFRRNFARCGGDGFFLAGLTPKGDDVGCNDNLFEFNDGSLSPNIAFEATFSFRNVFRGNWADRCNYGFWLGFSGQNVLEGNRMLYNRQAGIAVEHGVDFEVRDNDFQSNGHGILLWTKLMSQFDELNFTNKTSRNWVIEHNKFFKNHYGIAIRADQDHGIRKMPSEQAGREDLRPLEHYIRHNDIQDNRVGIQLAGTDRTVIEKNKLSGNVEANLREDDTRETQLGHNLGMFGAYL